MKPMKTEDKMGLIAVVLLLIVTALAGSLAGIDRVQKQAIANGHAHYNMTNRVFTWGMYTNK
jgi:hypothetical protein